MIHRPRIALVVDPRFPGGTSSAVAQEIRALAPIADLQVHGLMTRMFKGDGCHSAIKAALDDVGLTLICGAPVIGAETVVLHNPSCLKFDDRMPARIHAEHLIVVGHENFLQPDGSAGFDVGHCLGLIDRHSVAVAKHIAPVSSYNRRNIAAWLSAHETGWSLTDFDWFNICDFAIISPTATPRDRRGRMSRPGFDKFPSLAELQRQFPPTAEVCRIMGADTLMRDANFHPSNWELLPFRAEPVDSFLSSIDFFIYYTGRHLRESFGRVIAEAICAGKVVITDKGTAETFGSAVIACDSTEIDEHIHRLIAAPDQYTAMVRSAQESIGKFGSDHFCKTVLSGIQSTHAGTHAIL
jgi:hypothetical protein